MLTPEQQEALKFAFKVIKDDGSPIPRKESEIVIFIDGIFNEPAQLKKAWDTAGFPFEKINSVFEDLTGKEHSVFVELFDGSFISSMAGNYKENSGECGEFLPESINSYCLPGKLVAGYFRAQELLA
jgi:hypothetical protein